MHGRTHGRTDTKVILYSVQCYALHWTDNETLIFETIFSQVSSLVSSSFRNMVSQRTGYTVCCN